MNGEVENTADGIEIYKDDKGNRLVRIGDKTFFVGNTGDVKDVVERLGLEDSPQQIPGYLKTLLGAGLDGASVLPSLLGNAEQWVKLTDKTFEAVRKHGLMPTGVKGESYAMVGSPGKIKEWPRVDLGSLSQSTNPVNLARFSNIMSAMARQYEVRRLHDHLNQIEGSVEKVLQNQLNERITEIRKSARILDDAWTSLEEGGDLEINWEKVRETYGDITNSHERALEELQNTHKKLKEATGLKALKALEKDQVERSIKVESAFLLQSLQLEGQRALFEIVYKLATKPEGADGHLKGLEKDMSKRKEDIVEIAKGIVKELDEAGGRAKRWALFHPDLANAFVASSNEVAKEIESHFDALEVPNEKRSQLSAITRGQVLRNSEALLAAGEEALPVVGTAVVAIAATAVVGGAIRNGVGGGLQSLMSGANNQIQKMPPAK